MKLAIRTPEKIQADPNGRRRVPICENAIFRTADEFFVVAALSKPRHWAKKLNLDLDDVFNERLSWRTSQMLIADLKAAGEIAS
jgi:hypothetical protein